MTKGVTLTGRVSEGRLPRDVGERLAALIRQAEGKLLSITVAERKKARSLSVNSFLWGAVYPAVVSLFREQGNMVDAEDVHAYCKEHVGKLRQVVILPDGEIKYITGSTARLTPREMSDYIEAIRAYFAPFGCVIPEADPFHHTTNQEEPVWPEASTR